MNEMTMKNSNDFEHVNLKFGTQKTIFFHIFMYIFCKGNIDF